MLDAMVNLGEWIYATPPNTHVGEVELQNNKQNSCEKFHYY